VIATTNFSRAQQPPAVDQKASGADVVAPRGQRAPRDVQYSGWRNQPPGAKMVCRTTASGTWDTGQVAVRVDLVEAPNGQARLQIQNIDAEHNSPTAHMFIINPLSGRGIDNLFVTHLASPPCGNSQSAHATQFMPIRMLLIAVTSTGRHLADRGDKTQKC
jgi:hypothetical protein